MLKRKGRKGNPQNTEKMELRWNGPVVILQMEDRGKNSRLKAQMWASVTRDVNHCSKQEEGDMEL